MRERERGEERGREKGKRKKKKNGEEKKGEKEKWRGRGGGGKETDNKTVSVFYKLILKTISHQFGHVGGTWLAQSVKNLPSV